MSSEKTVRPGPGRLDRLARGALRNPLGALSLAVLAAAAAWFAVPFLAEMPDYLADARRLAGGALLAPDYFTPVGYPALIAPFLRLGGIGGVILFQSAVYVATVLAAWWVARRGFEQAGPLANRVAALCLIAVAVHPYLILDTHRIDDNALNALILVLFARWCAADFALPGRGAAAGYGLAVGMFAAVRPNAALFALLPLVGLATAPRETRLRSALVAWPVFAAAALAGYAALVGAATGSASFWPSNGPYNLFAGNNPFAFAALIHKSNAEQSVRPALDALGLTQYPDAHAVPPGLYLSLALDFMRHHPVKALGLAVTKLLVFFAPRTVHSASLAATLAQIVLSLPAALWAVVAWSRWRREGWRACGPRLVFLALYILPFVASNADSRFRMPLDIWFLLDVAAMTAIAPAWQVRAR